MTPILFQLRLSDDDDDDNEKHVIYSTSTASRAEDDDDNETHVGFRRLLDDTHSIQLSLAPGMASRR